MARCAALALAASFACSVTHAQEPVTFIAIAPPVAVDDVRVVAGPDTIVTVADLRAGHPAVINIWATWCAPCVAELPTLDALAGALGETAIVILANGERGPIARRAAFLDRLEIDRPIRAFDSAGLLAAALTVGALPTTVLVDRDGMAFARVDKAADWSAPALIAALEQQLGLNEEHD